MKVMVLGGSGLVGYHIAKKLSDENAIVSTFNNNKIVANGCSSIKVNALDNESIQNIISKYKPELIVDTIAFPNVDKCETDLEITSRINVETTRIIVKECKNFNTKIIFISTAFVFGNNEKIYTESDAPKPINNYGRQKLQSEEIIEESGLPYLILRTDQIYGWSKIGQRQSFVSNVLYKLKNDERIDVCIDWYNNPTYVDDISDCVDILVRKKKTGIYHVVGNSYINRYEWGIRIAKKFNHDEKLINAIYSKDLNLPAIRPNCNLSSVKITNDTGFQMKSVDDGLDFMYRYGD
ncbi:MAG: SDR family oxidoreductase [Patescibacteria group bacterium]|nr:SDR family oxidoreductase [Patescibacteria group bacterium]